MINHITIDKDKLLLPIDFERISNDINDVYNTFCAELLAYEIYFTDEELKKITELIYGDLKSRIEQDPISISEEFIYTLSRSFKVIFFYRIANAIFYMENNEKLLCKAIAFKISEYATSITAIEIHPQAKIGKSFVIDHGVNTLIGATSEIGNNCTILQNVVLGSRKITFNENKKRHPTIGNNVHISGGVRILGAVEIGNYVKIGPDCLIVYDVEDQSIIKLKKTQLILKEMKNEL
jgi:serine O-acetyltransferase